MGKNEIDYTDPVIEKVQHATKNTDAEDQQKEASDEVSNPPSQTPERKAKRRNSKKR